MKVAHEVARPFNNHNAPLSEAKPSPSWSRLCPGICIGRGLARIARLLWGKAPWGAGIACPPPGTARRGATREGEEVEGATPCFSALVRHRAGGGGARQNPPPPLPFLGGRSLHSDPWREGHRALPRLGRINRPVRFPHRRRDLRSLRGKSVQEAFRGVLVCQGVRKSSLPGKARGFRGGRTRSNASPSLLAPSRPRSWEREAGAAG